MKKEHLPWYVGDFQIQLSEDSCFRVQNGSSGVRLEPGMEIWNQKSEWNYQGAKSVADLLLHHRREKMGHIFYGEDGGGKGIINPQEWEAEQNPRGRPHTRYVAWLLCLFTSTTYIS